MTSPKRAMAVIKGKIPERVPMDLRYFEVSKFSPP